MKVARNCKQVVDALGGAIAFAAIIKCSRTSPYNYIARGTFPREVAPSVLAACGANQIAVPIALFDGLSQEMISNMVAAKILLSPRKGARSHG